MAGDLYKQVLVWKRTSDAEVAVYVCMERITDLKVCVQNVEFFRQEDAGNDWNRLMKNTGDLFLDDELDNRCTWHDDLQSAIAAHDKYFWN